jgi:hypothetical protein
MIKKTIYLLWGLAVLVLMSCKSSDKRTDTYFGGKIINPKTDYLVLFQMEKAIDTFRLDASNRFLGKIDLKDEGLYYFKHGREHQYLYLEPADSLLIRINTLSFDESIVFSGKGAERNNFLLDCFIDGERDEKNFYDYYLLNPSDFKQKIDSIEKIKLEKLEDFFKRNPNETDNYKEFLSIAITYPLYSKIENFPLKRSLLSKAKDIPEIPEDFYSHREKVDLNKESLIYYYVYSNYLTNHLYNKTYSRGFTPNTKDYSADFSMAMLNVIHKNISSEKTKNILLRQTINSHFFRKSSCITNYEVFNTFLALSTSEKDKTQIKNLIEDLRQQRTGSRISNFNLIDYTNKIHNSNDLLKNKNSLIYFWNPTYVSEDYLASRIGFLISKNPEVQFIGVKIEDNSMNYIKGIDIKSQYFIDSSSNANEFLTSKLPRTILVNKDGLIINGYASFSSKKIYSQVEELAKN